MIPSFRSSQNVPGPQITSLLELCTRGLYFCLIKPQPLFIADDEKEEEEEDHGGGRRSRQVFMCHGMDVEVRGNFQETGQSLLAP